MKAYLPRKPVYRLTVDSHQDNIASLQDRSLDRHRPDGPKNIATRLPPGLDAWFRAYTQLMGWSFSHGLRVAVQALRTQIEAGSSTTTPKEAPMTSTHSTPGTPAGDPGHLQEIP